MKRFFAGLMSVMVIGTALAGCGEKKNNDKVSAAAEDTEESVTVLTSEEIAEYVEKGGQTDLPTVDDKDRRHHDHTEDRIDIAETQARQHGEAGNKTGKRVRTEDGELEDTDADAAQGNAQEGHEDAHGLLAERRPVF